MSNETQMHEEHRTANREHAAWLRDISHWRVDHHSALAILNRVQAQIHDFDAEMEAHASAIRDHHLHIAHHERELNSAAMEQTEQAHEHFRKEHEENMALHADVSERHIALAAQHQEMMVNIAALFEELMND